MANLINILASVPTGLWQKIIFAFSNAVKNYALAIILLTLCIKIVMLPFDYLNRRASVKMTEIQEKLAPQMQKIKQRYPDQATQNQKINELYQKEGFNPMGSCLPILISLVLSSVVFFTLWGGLNSVASYKITTQYEKLQEAYLSDYSKTNSIDLANLTQEQKDNLVIEVSESGETNLKIAQDNVKKEYKNVKDSFLWIKNVWIADSAFKKSIPTFESYASTAKLKFENDAQKEQSKKVYETVMANLESSQGVNGYFILTILAAGTTFLSQYLNSKRTKKDKNKKTNYSQKANINDPTQAQASTGKTMMIIFPIIMGVFTLTSNAIFGIYIVTSQLFATATAPLINLIIKKTTKNK